MMSFLCRLLQNFGVVLVVVGLSIGTIELRAEDPGSEILPCSPTPCNASCTGSPPCGSMTKCKLGPNCSGCTCSDRASIGDCSCISIYF
jgi:hypothetical protein